mgnify:CR=1 FL=1
MFQALSVVKETIESLYDAMATIYVDNPTADQYGAVTHPLTKKLASVRCRISYKRILPVVTNDIVDKDIQKIIMIYTTNAAIKIPDGSKNCLLHGNDGRTDTFQNSSLPKVYQYTTQLELQRMAVKHEDTSRYE